jgi:hypothetical protein
MTVVAIAALTFQRPVGLARLLAGVAALDVPEGVEPRLVIVDNDPEGSGRAAVEGWSAPGWPPATYAVEPQRGIATARNRSVALADGADFVALIDDDEVPEPTWLRELLAAQEATGADVVQGRVVAEFDQPPEPWVIEGRFFVDKPRTHLGTLHYANSNNTLVRASLLRAHAFDPRYDLTGGSDSQLFARLRRAGADIRWSDHAVVRELVPGTRVDRGWLVRREYRRGVTLSRVLIDVEPSTGRVVKRVGAGVVSMGSGLATTAVGLVRRDRAEQVRGQRQVAYGAGLLAGLAGLRYEEYRRTHGH